MKRFLVQFLLVSLIIVLNFSNGFCIDAPTNLTATYKGNSILLKWNTVSGATGYFIERSTNDGEFESVGYSSGNSGQFSDLDIEKNKNYSYRVIARDASNNKSSYSNVAYASKSTTKTTKTTTTKTNKTSKTVISSPENLRAKYSKADGGIVLTWDGDYDLSKDKFNIYRSTGDSLDSDDFKKIDTISDLEELKYVDTNVEKNKVYHYYIEAVSGQTKSEKSKLVTAKAAGSGKAESVGTVQNKGPVYIGFASNANFLALSSINSDDGSVYIAFYDHSTRNWYNWVSYGNVPVPFPNYEEGSMAIDMSFREPSDDKMAVCLYSWNKNDNSMYTTTCLINIKTRSVISPWQAWTHVPNISKPADKFIDNSYVTFGWEDSTHWFIAWSPEEGNAYVKAITGGTGFMNAGLEVPSNYGENCHCAAGMYKDKSKNLVTGLMCFNMDDFTVTYSENSGPGYSWRSFVTISNKSVGMPPNAKNAKTSKSAAEDGPTKKSSKKKSK